MATSSAAARVALLSRHLEASEHDEEQARGLEMCPTSATGSVFAGVPQAPEDPILGVRPPSFKRSRAKPRLGATSRACLLYGCG